MRSRKKRVISRVNSTEEFIPRSSERISKRRTTALEDRKSATVPPIRMTRRIERKKTAVPKSSQRVSKRRTTSCKCPESPEELEFYKHRPLDTCVDEIRLLKLRREEEGPVHCEVKAFPLEDAPLYIALSYRWGPQSPLHDVHIEGKALKIRDILNSCLLELREDLDAWLWIDQICIAQADISERNHQVGIMSRIYSNSASVIIWLGDIPLAYPRKDDRFNDQDLDVGLTNLLLRNKYFTRMWIIQEILLAKKIKLYLNGYRCIKWSTIHKMYKCNAPPYIPTDPLPRALLHFAFETVVQHLPLVQLLVAFSFSPCECEDPRDKVYGLMGIVRAQDKLVVDYRKSVFEVYLDAIMIMLRCRSACYLVSSILFTLGKSMGIEKPLIRHTELWLEGNFGTLSRLKSMESEEL
jgi:hypothetical protein